VTIEELISIPRAACEFFPFGSLPTREQGDARVRRLLPHAIPGMEMDRIELPPRGRMVGIPHTPGTQKYLTCDTGEIVLVAAGEKWHLHEGDVIAFRGDQRHSYSNPGSELGTPWSSSRGWSDRASVKRLHSTVRAHAVEGARLLEGRRHRASASDAVRTATYDDTVWATRQSLDRTSNPRNSAKAWMQGYRSFASR